MTMFEFRHFILPLTSFASCRTPSSRRDHHSLLLLRVLHHRAHPSLWMRLRALLDQVQQRLGTLLRQVQIHPRNLLIWTVKFRTSIPAYGIRRFLRYTLTYPLQ